MIAFGERERATLGLVNGLPTLIMDQHVYGADELPKGTKLIVPPATDIPQDDRENGIRLIDAARRAGFEIVADVARQTRGGKSAATR